MSDFPHDANESVAIIGLAGRFPGAQNVEEFWENLIEGRETLSFFSDEELDPAAPDEMAARGQPDYVRARGILEDVEMFDAEFFGINPSEAEVLDPQQRIFMETAWEALEAAGYDPRSFAGAIGVFAGMSNNYYFLQNLLARDDVTDIVGWLTTMMGNEKDYLATRVSYKLDLRGPALNVQTACSTSLVAVGAAVQSLLNYQCDMALAGGVSVTLPQKRGYLYQEGGITSPDGHCRPFDESAAGTGFQQRRRHRDAPAPERCAGRRRHDLCRHQGGRPQQRRRLEGELHGAQRRRARRGHHHGVGSRRGRSTDHLVRRGPRDRHAARRPHRDRRPDAGISRRRSVGKRLLRDRIGQEQRRPSRRGRRCRRPHQDGPRLAPQDTSAEPALHGAEPEARSRGVAVRSRHRDCVLGSRPTARRAAPASAPSASGGRMPT